MTHTETLLIISIPIAFLSLVISYLLLIKYKPLPKHKLIVGSIVGILSMALVVSSAFINEYTLAAAAGLILPPVALWMLFLMQPSIRSWDKKREENFKKQKGKLK